jgi:undecaprenyl pyrophosphate synthase
MAALPMTSDLLKQLQTYEQVPGHVAIIMDGNGRWAKQRGLPRHAGHREGMKSVREAVEASIEAGVGILTLFAFPLRTGTGPPRACCARRGGSATSSVSSENVSVAVPSARPNA